MNNASKASKASSASKAYPLSAKKVLIITYYWPPSGGAGVQRWLKFSKYLPEFGCQPHIITVDPDNAEYPAWDTSLITDINPQVQVHTTRARNYFRSLPGRQKGSSVGGNNLRSKIARFIRGNFFIPDPRKGWNKYAIHKAGELIEKEGINIIITSGPPHSTHLIGRQLKRKFRNIKWIADFRDPWTDIYYYSDFYGSVLASNKDKKYEYSVLLEADKILTIGDGMKELLKTKTQSSVDKIHILPNGFDEEDFRDSNFEEKSSGSIITYVGGITDQYPIEPFLAALSEIAHSDPEREIVLRLVGSVSGGVVDLIRKHRLFDICEFINYSNHGEAINYISSASILLLLIPAHTHNKVIVTGKIFEYIRSGNAILGLGPTNGDAAKVLQKTKSGEMIDPDNSKAIRDFIENNMLKNALDTPDESVMEYERKNITERLLKLLDF